MIEKRNEAFKGTFYVVHEEVSFCVDLLVPSTPSSADIMGVYNA